MNQNIMDDVVKDVLRAALMSVLTSGITLATLFGFDLTSEQQSGIILFFNNVIILSFLCARLLKIAHDSRPAQVQVVDASGAPADVTLTTTVPQTPPRPADRSGL